MSSHQRAVVVESDPQYIEEVSNLLIRFRRKEITARKFARGREHAVQQAYKRAGTLLESVTVPEDEMVLA